MTFFLNKLIPDSLHQCPKLEYRRCLIEAYYASPQEKAEAAVKLNVATKEGYKLNSAGEIDHKTFLIENRRWREGFHPKVINGKFLALAVASMAVFAATLLVRTAQFIYLVVGVYFRAYKATFDDSDKEGLSRRVYDGLVDEFSRSGGDLQKMGAKVTLDVQCFAAMELACCLGLFTFNQKQMVHMELVFAKMENQWNNQRPYDGSFQAKFYRWAKHDEKKDVKGLGWATKFIQILNNSNWTFYIWMDAQPRSKDYINRLQTISTGNATYRTYEELDNYFKNNSTQLPNTN